MTPLRILFISSMPPDYSAGLARDFMKAMKLHGHEVDFLTRYSFPGQVEGEYNVYPESLSIKIRRWKDRHPFIKKNLRFLKFLLKKDEVIKNKDKGINITCPREDLPTVPIPDVLNKINRLYDLVVTVFWQNMITTCTLKAIYDKLQCPIIIRSVDMETFTGGCFYFMNCRNFTHECGCCPALNSNDANDLTHLNFLKKKEMYSQMNYAIGFNTWMQQFSRKSGLFDPSRIITTSCAIDESIFKPMPKNDCRKILGIPSDKTFILFARRTDITFKPKGFKHLIKSVNLFIDGLTKEERKKCLLVLAGQANEDCRPWLHIDTMFLGQISRDSLIKAYNASNIFLSPSIDDAGPSMVNQSIMCGTPVICFNIGTAIDVISNGISGYKVPVKDDNAFANSIETIYKLTRTQYDQLRKTTREMALKHNSLESFANMIESTYNKLSN